MGWYGACEARMHVQSLTRTRTHTRTHAHTRTHMHTHTHARTHARAHADTLLKRRCDRPAPRPPLQVLFNPLLQQIVEKMLGVWWDTNEDQERAKSPGTNLDLAHLSVASPDLATSQFITQMPPQALAADIPSSIRKTPTLSRRQPFDVEVGGLGPSPEDEVPPAAPAAAPSRSVGVMWEDRVGSGAKNEGVEAGAREGGRGGGGGGIRPLPPLTVAPRDGQVPEPGSPQTPVEKGAVLFSGGVAGISRNYSRLYIVPVLHLQAMKVGTYQHVAAYISIYGICIM